MALTLTLYVEIQSRRTSNGLRYRVKESNYDNYLTGELTRTEVEEWVRNQFNILLERKMERDLFHRIYGVVAKHFTSGYGIGSARGPKQKWDDECS